MFDVMRMPRNAIRLAGWAGVNSIESFKIPCQGISLMELKRKMSLRRQVDANNLEPSPMVSHGGATSATKQVKQSRS
jgi:hypothetical protein